MLRLTLEVSIPTPSQDQLLPPLAPTLDHFVVPICIPTRHRGRIQEEAKGRVVTIVLGQGHLVIELEVTLKNLPEERALSSKILPNQKRRKWNIHREVAKEINIKNPRREEKEMRMKDFLHFVKNLLEWNLLRKK